MAFYSQSGPKPECRYFYKNINDASLINGFYQQKKHPQKNGNFFYHIKYQKCRFLSQLCTFRAMQNFLILIFGFLSEYCIRLSFFIFNVPFFLFFYLIKYQKQRFLANYALSGPGRQAKYLSQNFMSIIFRFLTGNCIIFTFRIFNFPFFPFSELC